jgi:hypothetical protein
MVISMLWGAMIVSPSLVTSYFIWKGLGRAQTFEEAW